MLKFEFIFENQLLQEVGGTHGDAHDAILDQSGEGGESSCQRGNEWVSAPSQSDSSRDLDNRGISADSHSASDYVYLNHSDQEEQGH